MKRDRSSFVLESEEDEEEEVEPQALSSTQNQPLVKARRSVAATSSIREEDHQRVFHYTMDTTINQQISAYVLAINIVSCAHIF